LPDGTEFPESALLQGWLRVREDAGKRDQESEELLSLIQKLQATEARAKADSKGVWADGRDTIECEYELADSKSFVDQHKGQDLEGVVEKVLTGDRVIARIFGSPKKHVQTMVLIAGLRAPSTKRVNTATGEETAGEPFGDDAQTYIENRLLQRGVKIVPLGVSPQGQLIATVKHPERGSIAPYILKDGLARCTDHHSTLLGAQMSELRKAEKEAQEKQLNLHRGHVQRKVAPGEAEAVVSRVQSADTLFVRSRASGAEKRISLSSVRQPKTTDPKQSPWGAEAKEFMRKKLIGKHVKVVIDGKRAATEGYEEREMATVTLSGKNIGLNLVENGYASVIRHRADDHDRSSIYDELLQAEQQAQEAGKGIWSEKPPATKSFVDYSESLEKAKRQLTLLSRQKKVPAIVDFVKSGSRFTLLIPRDNAKITFVLSGISAPKSARNPTDKGEPFGQEAHDFANRRCLQRDVEIDVEGVDKVGGFIGTLYINRENFAKLLVEEGLASVHAYSAEKSGNLNELSAAEKKAQDARKGRWHDYDPSQEEESADAPSAPSNGANGEGATTRAKDYRDVVITDIDETGRLKLQQIGKGTAALTELMSKFRSFHISPTNATPLPGPPKAGEYVAAKFTEDGEWYRARVRRNDREAKKSEVVYVDYGNSEVVPWSTLRPLAAQFSTQTLKPQAVDAVLSLIQLPTAANYLADVVDFLRYNASGREMVANVDYISPEGILHVTLFDPKTSPDKSASFNAEVIAEGLALVPKKLKAWERSAQEVLKALKEREAEAKEGRKGIWEYGDLTEDD